MNIFVVGIIIFVIAVSLIEVCRFAYKAFSHSERTIVKKRLRELSSGKYERQRPDILKRRSLSEIPLFHRILMQFSGIERLETLLRQANTRFSLGFYMLLAVLLASLGFIGVYIQTRSLIAALVITMVMAYMPFLYLKLKKKKRVAKFERQLPEALDLIARALKAGHGFTSGMKLAADEFEDPIGTEFEQTLDEINYGVAVQDALTSLGNRISCHELRYFIVSVILQRETGGNLAEIIENTASLIRERFNLQSKIKVLSTDGRWSMRILAALPILQLAVFRVLHPEYFATLFSEPMGRFMAIAAAINMLLGIVAMKRIVDIQI
jgi:tight adherence protein B